MSEWKCPDQENCDDFAQDGENACVGCPMEQILADKKSGGKKK